MLPLDALGPHRFSRLQVSRGSTVQSSSQLNSGGMVATSSRCFGQCKVDDIHVVLYWNTRLQSKVIVVMMTMMMMMRMMMMVMLIIVMLAIAEKKQKEDTCKVQDTLAEYVLVLLVCSSSHGLLA